MKRVTVIVKGEVQRVGYRDIVEKIARKLKLVGFVENLKPYDVKIIAEGEEEVLKKFIELIDIKKYPVDVEKVVVRFEEPTGEFEYFEIKRGEWHEELGERMDIAGTYLYKSVELGEKSVNIGEKMLDKQDKMLGKQDQMLGKHDQTVSIIREGNDRLCNKIDDFHNDSNKISDKMDNSLNLFHQDTNKRFDVLDFKSWNICDVGEFQAFSSSIYFICDEKYGEISKNMVRAVEGIEKILEKSERDREDYRKSMDNLVGAIVKLAEKK